MLYPKEDKQTTKLMFACRTCQYSEEAQSSCVFRNNMYNTVGETAGVTQDVGSDPTVGDPSSSSFPFTSVCTADPSSSSCCTLCGIKIEEEEDEDEEVDDMDVMMMEDQEEEDYNEEHGEELEGEMGSVDDAYLSETQYGPDGKVLSTSDYTDSSLIQTNKGHRLTLTDLSQMEEEEGEEEE